jgi:hypothetical protein
MASKSPGDSPSWAYALSASGRASETFGLMMVECTAGEMAVAGPLHPGAALF